MEHIYVENTGLTSSGGKDVRNTSRSEGHACLADHRGGHGSSSLCAAERVTPRATWRQLAHEGLPQREVKSSL